MRALSIFLVLLSSSFAMAERPLRGVYTVPVPIELEAFNSFPVSYKSGNFKQSPTELTFPLPTALVGGDVQVAIKQDPKDTSHWSGPNADGTCKNVGRNFQCHLRFNDLVIDPIQVEMSIREQFKNEAEIAGRIKVAQQFGGEPVGIISYRIRKNGRGVEL